MIRRENSQHPHSGLFKIPLLPAELAQGIAAIRRLARQPRCLPARLAPPTHSGLAEYLQQLVALITVQEEQRRAAQADRRHTHNELADLPLPVEAGAPLCIQRILAQDAPEGSSNMPLITLLSYWRASGVSEADATRRATAWLLHRVTDPAKQEERLHSARSVGHAVYTHHYQFAHHFVAPLRIVTDRECGACPIRMPCWGGSP